MTNRNKLRDTLRNNIISKWFQEECIGWALAAMGTGKSRIIAEAINKFMESEYSEGINDCHYPILIGVPSRYLRDQELPNELEKWGCKHKVKIACYQSICKWNKTIGLFIADELDFALSEEEKYMKSFTNNYISYFFGLTGTMIESKYFQTLKTIHRHPFFEYPLRKAQIDGVINKTEIWLHQVPFILDPYEDTPYGEISKYKWIQKHISEAKEEIEFGWHILKNQSQSTPLAIQIAQEKIDKYNGIKKYWESSGRNKNSRLKFLRSSESTKQYARNLKEAIFEYNEDNKVIIFSVYTRDVDEITPYAYHGKSDNPEVIQQFNRGEIRELGACKKVNRGVNFTGLNHCIVQSYTTSLTNAMQAYIGRMVRLDPDETAYIHMLYSVYWINNQIQYAHNYQWIQDLLSNEELSHINVYNYDEGL